MCGIGLIVQGAEIVCGPCEASKTTADGGHSGCGGVLCLRPSPAEEEGSSPSVAESRALSSSDMKRILARRGPDYQGIVSVPLCDNPTATKAGRMGPGRHQHKHGEGDGAVEGVRKFAGLQIVGAELQLRGSSGSVMQPLQDEHGNVLAFNGEVFGGLELGPEENDAEALLEALAACCSCCTGDNDDSSHRGVMATLSVLRGPWALLYWQEEARRLWVGRDVIGRRSLLLHRPARPPGDGRLLFCSACPCVAEQQGASATAAAAAANADPEQETSAASAAAGELEDREPGNAWSLKKTYVRGGGGEEGRLPPRVHGGVQYNGTKGWAEPPSFPAEENGASPLSTPDLTAVPCSAKAGRHKQHVPRIERRSARQEKWCQKRLLLLPNATAEVKGHSHPFQTGRDGQGTATAEAMLGFWEELPCGVFSITFTGRHGVQTVHPWEDPLLLRLENWQRQAALNPCQSGQRSSADSLSSLAQSFPALQPEQLEGRSSEAEAAPQQQCQGQSTQAAEELGEDLRATVEEMAAAGSALLGVLSSAVARRVTNICDRGASSVITAGDKAVDPSQAQVAVLFSGGLDSMLLAVLADRHVAPQRAIELVNVSFAGSAAPDRQAARAALSELCHLAPARRWRLVEVDGSLEEVESQRAHLLALLSPALTHMDFNIGAALWLAARGVGTVTEVGCGVPPDGGAGEHLGAEDLARRGRPGLASSRVLLLGTGADEQCGGYARYRTKFRLGGWQALEEEMRLDMKRLWCRNLGRDDRCLSDHGREARFPYLDEEVIEFLLSLPLHVVTDLRLPPGVGDKRLLREVAKALGIRGATCLPKRAIQFGSHIAKASNKKEFGSNRAANQLSAGSLSLSG